MDAKTVRETAYAMPFTSPAYAKGPIRFCDRTTLKIAYKTDIDALRRVVPEPLEVVEPIAMFEVIHMPDSTGLGDYCESGQVIPVQYQGVKGNYVHMMFLNNLPGIVAGRERFGFPKKWGHPKLEVREDTLVGTLDYAGERVATATMGYKYQAMDLDAIARGTSACVGQVPDDLVFKTNQPLLIKATGHGTRQRCRPNKFGFPKSHASKAKFFQGFQTGDLVSASVPKGKFAGQYVGRIAIRFRTSFVLQLPDKKFDVHGQLLFII